MKPRFKETGKMIECKDGLVDLICKGVLYKGAYKVPCLIGYRVYGEDENGYLCEPTHIFVDDGITDDGYHYYAETIEL